MNMLARRCAGASGSVIANTMANAAPLALVMNHLWPLITQLSPSRTAVLLIVVGSEPETSGSVMAIHDRTSSATSGSKYLRFCAAVAAIHRISVLPVSGAEDTSGCIGPRLDGPDADRIAPTDERPAARR